MIYSNYWVGEVYDKKQDKEFSFCVEGIDLPSAKINVAINFVKYDTERWKRDFILRRIERQKP